jgi:class 3 adenylate cyclase
MTMACESCGHESPPANRFCEECGAALARRCGGCGADVPPTAKFCGACGASLAAGPAHRPSHGEGPGRRARAVDGAEVRKIVTIVFADLIGSTALHERLDPESVSRVMDRYHRTVRGPVEAHGGTVVQLLGDGVMCAFGVPRVAEDDAIRAVRAAVGIQRAFREFAREESAVVGDTGLRVAVNTGEVVVSDDYAAGIGDPLNVAARLQQEGRDGDVLIAESTERLVRALVTLAPFGVLSLKGRSETVTAYRVVSLERPGGASAVAFVGREEELGRIGAVYDAAVATPAARLAVILGSPGLGKSRLLDEFTRRLDGTTVLTAQCEAAGGMTFAPIAKALRAVLGVDDAAGGDALRTAIEAATPGDDADRSRIAAGIGALLAGTPASPEETFFVVRRFLAGLAAGQPVVLAIDDLQWAEPLLLDLIEHLVQWSAGVPLFLLAAARPELRDARSALASAGRLVTDVVTLGGLDAGAATRLAANVIGADALPAAVAGRVLATSEGNPLFVGELVRMLVHDGALKREGDRWTTGVELARLEMPPTIQALLAARIERLRPEERTVLERAAVVGRQFSRAAVAHLLPREIADLDARLEALRRSELIEPDTGWLLGEPVLRFHHVLIRDAAYRRVLKGTRAELHGRFADWLEARVGEAVEHDETLGWHLEQAHQHLRELGPVDAGGRTLGERAARYLAAAGRRALARDDLPPAASLLGRALDRLDAADPARADLALDWCEALLSAGDVGPATRALEELGRFTGDSARLRAWHTCFAGQLAALTDPQTLRATADAVAAASEVLAAAGDAAGEAKAHAVHAGALGRLGKVGAAEAALDRALAAARRADDRRRSNAVLAGAPLAALWGPSPVTRASGRCLDVVRVLRITQGAPAVEATALRCQGVLEALRGRTEAARRMIASSRHMVEELGITHRLLEADVFAGLIELLEGDAAAAERCLRAAYDGLRSHGLGIDAAQAAALLGRALLLQDRAAEAEALSHESEALAGDDLQAAIAWRGVRAEALARRGEHASAVEFARVAVDLAAATDSLLYHADARLALAAALRAAGRSDDAAAEEARAIELWEAKGATLLAERARGALGRDEPMARAADDRAGAARPTRRQVRANTATANVARLDAAIAARDADALPALFAPEMQTVTHFLAGHTYDRQGVLATWRSLLSAEAPTCRHEPLATLGDSLVLCVQSVSASGFAGRTFDVGPYEREAIGLVEVDPNGRQRRAEWFAADKLGDAVARLYERHADLLPEGPERVRAAATAHAVGAMLGQRAELDRWVGAFAPDIEHVDHRTVGFGGVLGAHEFRAACATLFELSDDVATRIEGIQELRSDALLLRWTNFGTLRAGGGAYERPFLWLAISGAAGLLTRIELFDPDREAEALARFDHLTREPSPARPARRPVRANAATVFTARLDAALAARDAGALPPLLTDRSEVIHHPTGTTYDGSGSLAAWRSLLRAPDLTHRHETLATLGDSLALCRLSISASGFARGDFDVGAYQTDEIDVIEVDAQGRRARSEDFAADKLGDAVARLYERYADLLPEGPERARAAATARSVAALLERPERWPFAPDVEFTDHRTVGLGSVHGAEAVVQGIRALIQLTDDFINRIDGVLALRPDALLVLWMNSGTERTSGGAFERSLCELWVFGADGLVTRWEQFDAEQDAMALARFDELTSEPSPARPARRPVRPNAATASAAAIEAGFAARDGDALADLLTDDVAFIDHTSVGTLDRRHLLNVWKAQMRVQDLTYQLEPLGTLGESLALCRQWVSASAVARGKFDVGAYDHESMSLLEGDAQARLARFEIFAAEHLGDAVARLYERHADLLPAGPARTRAAATARSVAVLLGPLDADRWTAAIAPDVECVDHRPLGLPPLHGAEAFLGGLRSLLDLVEDTVARVDDVLALRPNAILVRWTNLGTARAGGGAYERNIVALRLFGADGLLTRYELFAPERVDEALARLEELTSGPRAARPVRRRLRPNAATAHAARTDAVIAARDADALPTLAPEGVEAIDHMTGVTYDGRGVLASWRAMLRGRDLTHRHEALATLGDSLALCRLSISASAYAGRKLDVGAYERDEITLLEVDAQGRRRRTESFATDKLGDAVVRLYERHAELLPDGPARLRAVATARSVAAAAAAVDVERLAKALGPDFGFVDHRTLGFGTFSGQEAGAMLQGVRSWHDLGTNLALSVDDVLGLQSGAFLPRVTLLGTDRTGGGTFERPFLVVSVFDADGLVTRSELFDADRDDDALARFDELTAEPSAVRSPAEPPRAAKKRERRVRPNAATVHAARTDAAVAARDVDALPTMWTEDVLTVDHAHGVTYDRQGLLATFRSLLRAQDPTNRHDPLATLGDSLALFRVSTAASGYPGRKLDVGAYEREEIVLIEVDAEGRRRRSESFAPDHLGDAVARLYERYADLLPEGPARTRAAATARGAALLPGPYDTDRYGAALAPAIEYVDHRTHGVGSLIGPQAVLKWLRSLLELAEDVTNRVDDVLAMHSDALLLRWTNFGIDRAGGGVYERVFLWLAVYGSDGLVTRIELFEPDRDIEALARFDALTTGSRPTRFENAATRTSERLRAACAARDWGRFAALFPPGFRLVERRRMVQLEIDRNRFLDGWRPFFDMISSMRDEVLATRGDRLALVRSVWVGADADRGPSEVEFLTILAVEDGGELAVAVTFDPEDLDAAYAELDRRYAAGEAAPYAATWETYLRNMRAITARDWEQVAANYAPGMVMEDHRPLGFLTLRSREENIASIRAFTDLRPDATLRVDHLLALDDRRLLTVTGWVGSEPEGEFEIPVVIVGGLGLDGHLERADVYDLDQLDEARARFDTLGGRGAPASELRPDPLRIPPNAATRARDRLWEPVAAGDWEAVRALLAPACVLDDRRRLNRLTGDRDMLLASMQFLAGSGARPSHTVLATAGDRLALARLRFAGPAAESAPSAETFDPVRDARWAGFEIEALQVIEVDAEGRILASILFDPDDRRAASAEMFERYARSDEARCIPAACFESMRAGNARDLDRVRALLPNDFVFDDHRRTGLGRLESAADYLASLAALFELVSARAFESLYVVAAERHGLLGMTRAFGTLADGGEFEQVFVSLTLFRDDRVVGMEMFEPEDLDVARARFEELRPDPTRIPPNAAWRALERTGGFFRVRDWEGLRALAGADFTYEDRQKHALVTGDVDVWIKSAQEVASWPGRRPSSALIGTAGDRIILERVAWTGEPDTGEFEIEHIRLVEVAADGRFVAWIKFDPKDRSAAFAEARERFAAGEAAAIGGQAPFVALGRAFARRDWEAFRGCLAQDAVVCDRRAVSVFGTIDGDQWVELLRMLDELVREVDAEMLRIVAWNHRGRVDVVRQFGTILDGGAFEHVIVRVFVTDGAHIQRYELFDVGDLDRAVARFAELCRVDGVSP